MRTTLAEILKGHLTTRRWSFDRLAREASLSRSSLYRWAQDGVVKVRHWQDLVKAADALGLDQAQTDALLAAGGHPAIERLVTTHLSDDDRALLARWTAATPNNLPAQLTSFVGRGEELGQLHRLIASAAARLVTLTGPGGSGKTRLALEAAQAALDQFEDIAFVDLAPVRDPDLVMPTIARALDLEESADAPPLRALTRHLRDRKALLVLDNVEQVIAAGPLLTRLLMATPQVTALVTSRMRLNVRGEREFPVLPLPLPDQGSTFEQLVHNPAVALFVDRATAASPFFTLTGPDAPLVAEVCARLEGLPLAIELVAARTRHMRLGAMLERLPGRLELATGGPRDAPARQRTLRATIAWSYDLLTPDEQQLLDRLGVFVGGFTVPAAGSVCAAAGQAEIDASEGLDSLVEHNLLRRSLNADDEPRYEMLETIREYALERLEARGKMAATRAAAANYHLGLAERADLEGGRQAWWLRRLMAEHDNFRAALGWCREQGQTAMGLRLCLALMQPWQLRDHRLEAHAWLESFMASANGAPPILRARGLLWQGLLLMRQTGDEVSALPSLEESLGLFRDSRDRNGMSEALQAMGDVYRKQVEWKRAGQVYAESLALAEQSGNAYLVSHGWMGLALCAQEDGQFKAAEDSWQETLDWAERAEDGGTTAIALNGLGEMARYREDWGLAKRRYTQTLNLARKLGSEFRIALALHNLAYVDLSTGEPERAGRRFTESLLLYQGRQYHQGMAECLAGLGRVAATAGRPERAARLGGASETMLEGLGSRLDAMDRADYGRTLTTLNRELGDRLESLLDEGRAMSAAEAVTYAVHDRTS